MWQGAALEVGAEGETLRTFLNRLDGRAHGALALILGILLLLPVRWVLPQIAGLLLLASGWRSFAGSAAPFLPFIGGRQIAKPRLEAAGAFINGQSWISGLSPPRLDGLTQGFAQQAQSIALIVAGLAACVPATHFLLGLALIILGMGTAQRDGAASLAGIAATFAASVFTLTMVAGTAAGAPFAAAWSHENLSFFSAPAKPAP